MRIARALAAAALTLGLASTLTPAQAAPVAPPVVQVVSASVQAKAAKNKTKATVKAPSGKTKVGKTLKFTGKLTRKGTDGKYKALAKQKVVLMFPTESGTESLASAKTSKGGTYTIELKAKKWMVGEAAVFVHYSGNTNSKGADSNYVMLKVKK